jgi:ABC-type nitrate/sulfonate/bicarbonate transport system permease component
VNAARVLRGVGRRLELPLALLALGLAWHVLSVRVGNATLVPPPLSVLAAWREIAGSELPEDIVASLIHLGVGYGLGAATGFVLALLCARFAAVEAIADPAIELLRPIGAIAWIPIAILMFGVGRMVPIFLIFYASLFPIFINTFGGIKQVDPSLVNAARMLGASPRMVVTHVILPAALPSVLAGARLSLGVAWMSMVAAELVGADSGLGWRVFWYQEFFAMDRVMAVIVTIGVLGYLVDAALRALQAALLGWRPRIAAEEA